MIWGLDILLIEDKSIVHIPWKNSVGFVSWRSSLRVTPRQNGVLQRSIYYCVLVFQFCRFVFRYWFYDLLLRFKNRQYNDLSVLNHKIEGSVGLNSPVSSPLCPLCNCSISRKGKFCKLLNRHLILFSVCFVVSTILRFGSKTVRSVTTRRGSFTHAKF